MQSEKLVSYLLFINHKEVFTYVGIIIMPAFLIYPVSIIFSYNHLFLIIQVNKQFAIDLINSIPPKQVKERIVSCDGGEGALGHPKVYINLVS